MTSHHIAPLGLLKRKKLRYLSASNRSLERVLRGIETTSDATNSRTGAVRIAPHHGTTRWIHGSKEGRKEGRKEVYLCTVALICRPFSYICIFITTTGARLHYIEYIRQFEIQGLLNQQDGQNSLAWLLRPHIGWP